jgi:hypothetical protein
MKLKEPFAGFEHAQGHFMFHISMFLASWWCTSDHGSGHDHADPTMTSEWKPIH